MILKQQIFGLKECGLNKTKAKIKCIWMVSRIEEEKKFSKWVLVFTRKKIRISLKKPVHTKKSAANVDKDKHKWMGKTVKKICRVFKLL